VLDDLEPDRHLVQHFGFRLADLDQAGGIAVAAGAVDFRFMHHDFARQVDR
jgi:hypothetical protein